MKTALVTGASRGIGKEIARQLALDGFCVAINYLNSAEKANALVDELNSCGHTAKAYQCDVSNSVAVASMLSEIEKDLGEVCVLVNNAAVSEQILFNDISDEAWQKMIGTNLTGVFNCSRAVLPSMIQKKDGVIINISSMWGQVGGSCEVHYSAAKAGVIGLTKALAKEVAPSNIRVNCVAPGVIETDMMKTFDDTTKKELKNETPLLRLGTVTDVANAVSFLASEKASFITGQVLSVNGGLVI